MKLSRIASLLAGAGVLAAAQVALASDGTITFKGEVTANTCYIDINGTGPNAEILLPAISANALPSAGSTAGWTGFDINLIDCAGTPLATHAAAQFEAGADVDPMTGKLKNVDTSSTGAANVQVALRHINGQDINIGQGPNQSEAFPIVDYGATLRYEAGYYASATGVMPGLVEANVTYTIAYQ